MMKPSTSEGHCYQHRCNWNNVDFLEQACSRIGGQLPVFLENEEWNFFSMNLLYVASYFCYVMFEMFQTIDEWDKSSQRVSGHWR